MPEAAAKKSDPPEDDDEPSMFWDWDGLPAYRDAKGIMVVTYGGKERPVDDLFKFQHQAVPIEEDEFDELKKTVSAKPDSAPTKAATKKKET